MGIIWERQTVSISLTLLVMIKILRIECFKGKILKIKPTMNSNLIGFIFGLLNFQWLNQFFF